MGSVKYLLQTRQPSLDPASQTTERMVVLQKFGAFVPEEGLDHYVRQKMSDQPVAQIAEQTRVETEKNL
jgi:hypothetical protein